MTALAGGPTPGLGGHWLSVMLSDRVTEFYADYRWPGWQREVQALDLARAFHVWPPLVSVGPPITERSRKPVPVDELWTYALDLGEQLRNVSDGATVRFDVSEVARLVGDRFPGRP